MTEEGELIKRRANYKGRLTIFVKYFDELSDTLLDDYDLQELQLRLEKIEVLYDQYNEVQSHIECLNDNSDVQLSERSEFESRYFKIIARAKKLLESKTIQNTESSYLERGNDGHDMNKSVRSYDHQFIKLPTIQLPKFSGSYETWLEFRDTFTSLIHSNTEIDNINKYHYLRAALEGSAAVVIKSIEFSSKNYAVAWQLLCDRYDNKRLLVQNHISSLFNIPNVTKESSHILKNLIDLINKNIRALESLNEPVKQWDSLLIYIITNKLDFKTYREWEEYKGRIENNKNVTFDSFMSFLNNRADLIETLELSRSNQSLSYSKPNSKVRAMVTVQESNKINSESTTQIVKCPKCKGDHNLNTCSQFLSLSNNARFELLPTLKVCFNCLHKGHFSNNCRKPSCKICKRKHNTLVHVNDFKPVLPSDDTCNIMKASQLSSSESKSVVLATNITMHKEMKNCEMLLSTALIKIFDSENKPHIARAVLDCGSTSCFITESLLIKLNINCHKINKSVTGINNTLSYASKACQVKISSLNDQYSVNICCFTMPVIIDTMPSFSVNINDLKISSDIHLADPTFFEPSEIDILIGADIFWDLLGSQKISLGTGKPILFETKLGFIVSGPIDHNFITLTSTNNIRCNLTHINSASDSGIDLLRRDLMRFWELEEISCNSSHYSAEEKHCEEHFVENTKRLSDGRFCVRIPLKENPNSLGDSHERAAHCLRSLERRLSKNDNLSKLYHEFMSEYESLGHMTKIKNSNNNAHFIPHHGIMRENSETTKLRVVFNASSPTTSGVSFNELQMVGPTVQDELFSILIRFRQHRYVLSADVEKMYRQIIVHLQDRYLQQILWRDKISDSVNAYQLNTVTYGTASAPFLATRCLYELGLACDDHRIAEIIKHDFFVDDLLTGSNDFNEILHIRNEVTKILASAGMNLRKWRSNDSRLAQTEPSSKTLNLNIGSNEICKLLGLYWHADSDKLSFPLNALKLKASSKREILSSIAQIFDPLGLLSPFTIIFKMLMQKLWLNKLTWDQPIPDEIARNWHNIFESITILDNLHIPRVVCNLYKKLELHIFTDASERAYGACVYVRSITEKGEIIVRLLVSKSRVAPIKPLTIPRLELCGALLGARLYEKVIHSWRGDINRTICWTDSTIVLGWLQTVPSKLQPFVRNRVAEVLNKAGNCIWRHVPTAQNPADLISRGMDVKQLLEKDIWWSGPEFLKHEPHLWPPQINTFSELPETRPNVTLLVKNHLNPNGLIDFSRFSNYLRLLRSIAYVLRFINLCKRKPILEIYLTADELQNALNLIITKCQEESFPEYTLLLNKQILPKGSSLHKFNIFLDYNKIMRVGGRLENSQFAYNKKHPIILQSTHTFTKLVFAYEHVRLMHAGPQLLLSSIRENYWPIGGRNLAKTCYHKCLRCHRFKGKNIQPLMGNLPQQRLLTGFPFKNVGLDYAGPIMSASRQGRGCRLVKTYITIFICFSTKCIHLELVGDLKSTTFILALNRFIARRGKPDNIYSDNGTSFVGACNDISKFLKLNSNYIAENSSNDGITFHFIPAYSPHFGGLWEAGVKSTKFHLQRVLGNCKLTFEELTTTLTQIEAILNSRPLTPISSDPDDVTALTPGHFLIGRPLTSLPDQRNYNENISPITRFQYIEQCRQHFWARWNKEYISELQVRTKWRSNSDTLKIDTLVLVKEESLPPLKWKLGRVVTVYPGSDGIARVADIKTSSGIIRRAFNRICPLPVTLVGNGLSNARGDVKD